jgi:copper transport protein
LRGHRASFLEVLRLRVAFLLLFVMLALPEAAWAHARVLRTLPANGAVVAAAPTQVRVVFDDDVRVASGVKAIRNGDGSVLAGKPHILGGRVLVVPLQSGLDNGDYTVLWRALSDDGHTIAGVIAFGVGAGRAPPQAALSADNGPSAQDVLSRFLFFAGLLTAGGAAFFRFAVGAVPVRLMLVSFLSVFVGVSGVAHDASLSTRFGSAMVAAAALAGVGALTAAVAPLMRALEPVPFVVGLLLLPIPTVAGHAFDRGRPGYEPIVDFLHLAAASFWVGGVVALAVTFSSAREAPRAIRRFSNVALAAVIVIATSGVIRAFGELRSVSQLWSTGYGRVLIVKTALLAILVALGWMNRYRILRRPSLAGLRQNLAAEVVVFVGLVAAVALLTDLRPGRDRVAAAAVTKGPPPLPAARMVVQAKESGDYGVALAWQPPGAEVVVLGQDGNGVSGLDVRINGLTTRSCGAGCYGSFIRSGRVVKVTVNGDVLTFREPAKLERANRIVVRATDAFRNLRSVDYVERLASSPRNKVVSDFTLERPNRLMYRIKGGADGIVIGTRRWDRAHGGNWIPSEQTLTQEPEPIWTGEFTNAYLLETTSKDYVVALMKPLGPVWFTVRLDRKTYLPRSLRMTATAHFMTHVYTRFNGPRKIFPPR